MWTSTLSRIPASLLVAVGLAAGFGIAQGTGIRALGGAVFVACGVGAAWIAARRRGPAVTVGLAALYVGAFVLAHVLALGAGLPAWFAVGLVTVVAAGITYGMVDRSRAAVPSR